MTHRRLAIAVGVLGSMLLAPTALAGPPTVTTITIDVNLETGEEMFTTGGGVLCAAGIAETDGFVAGGGRQDKGAFSFHIIKTLTCDDDSGSFQIKVEAATVADGTRGGFAIVNGSGTGDYVGLQGAGSLIGEFTDVGILDHYVGRLSIG